VTLEEPDIQLDETDFDNATDKTRELQPAPRFIWTSTYWILFSMNFLSSWGDRMWAFAVPLLLAKMFTSLLPSSLFATISQLSCVVFGGYVGNWIDRTNRLKLQQSALLVQNLSVVLSFTFLIILEYQFIGTERIDPVWGNFWFNVLFFGAIALAAVAAVASMVTSVSISKEWLVVIQRAHPYLALTQVNSTFRRVDLVCKLASPLAFALILQFAGLTRSLIAVTVWNAFSMIPESLLMHWLYRKVPELAIPKEVQKGVSNPISEIIQGWRTYFAQPIFRSSFAYVLLYMTVLSPGGVMTAYLEFKNISELAIAIFTGLGALVGLLATFATPHLIDRLSLRPTGFYALWSQWATLLFSLAPFLWPNRIPIILLPIFVAVSRFGLWGFDLVEVQLMQTYVPEGERGIVSSVEYSLANLLSVGAYAMGIVVPDPKQFVILVIVSFLFVTAAATIYSWWHLRTPPSVLSIEKALASAETITKENLTSPPTLDLVELDVVEDSNDAGVVPLDVAGK
jgi:iron-regulated transporter 1